MRRDRKAGGGGLLVYHKKSYTILKLIIDSDFETTTLSVILDKTKHTFVTRSLESHLKSLIAQNHRNVTLIGGLKSSHFFRP